MDWLCLPTVLPQSSISSITSKSKLWTHRWITILIPGCCVRQLRSGLLSAGCVWLPVSSFWSPCLISQVRNIALRWLVFYSLVLFRSEGCHQDVPCGSEPTPRAPAWMGYPGLGRGLFSSSSGFYHDRWWPLVPHRICLAFGIWPHLTIYAEFSAVFVNKPRQDCHKILFFTGSI